MVSCGQPLQRNTMYCTLELVFADVYDRRRIDHGGCEVIDHRKGFKGFGMFTFAELNKTSLGAWLTSLSCLARARQKMAGGESHVLTTSKAS